MNFEELIVDIIFLAVVCFIMIKIQKHSEKKHDLWHLLFYNIQQHRNSKNRL